MDLKKNLKTNSIYIDSLNNILKKLNSSLNGLTNNQVKAKIKQYGYNKLGTKKHFNAFLLYLDQFKDPLIAILIFASIISFLIGDIIEATIILTIILINSILGFYQEYKANKTFELLKKYIIPKATVLRDNKKEEIESIFLVPGDIVFIENGDIVPADIRLIQAKNLTANESTITGESNPVAKEAEKEQINSNNINLNQKYTVFMGSTISSGYGYGVVIATGKNTYFGSIAKTLESKENLTNFQKNIANFSKLLLKITVIITTSVFIVNLIMHKNFFSSLMFSLALAVGITPELLPIIITIILSKGALNMAKHKVIVKKITSIENLGNMDTLCCDKTGTLTEGKFELINYLNLDNKQDENILILGTLCSSIDFLQNKAITNDPMEAAIWSKVKDKINKLKSYKILDKTAFDFIKRRTNILMKKDNQNILVSKGSPDSILKISSFAQINNQKEKLSKELLYKIINQINKYESQGYRIILIASKKIDTQISQINQKELNNLTIIGFLVFMDPVKKTAKESLEIMKKLGIDLKIITGDSALITKNVCNFLDFTIKENKIITGDDLNNYDLEKVKQYSLKYNVFARINPEQKSKIIETLSDNGHVVGFLGDGINDALAIKQADIGISVNTGTDITKNAADIILLKKSLKVLITGIINGRKAFANTIKYILTTISSNFGNITTIAITSLFLPFMPMLPSQILLTNFLTDIPLTTIASDKVDFKFLLKPKKWDISLISSFMILFGFISSFFDFCLILPLIILKASVAKFQTSWFIFSCFTEIVVIFAIRTRLSFFKSRPSNYLIISAIITIISTLLLTYISYTQKIFKFIALNYKNLIYIIIVTILYFLVVEFCKKYFFKKLNKVKLKET